jgi:hypothetical protein
MVDFAMAQQGEGKRIHRPTLKQARAAFKGRFAAAHWPYNAGPTLESDPPCLHYRPDTS